MTEQTTQLAEVNPWDKEAMDGMVVLMGIFLFLFISLFLFNFHSFVAFYWLILSFFFILTGLFCGWLVVKYFNLMSRSDKIGCLVLGIIGIGTGLLIRGWDYIVTYENWFQGTAPPLDEFVLDFSEGIYVGYSGLAGIFYVASGFWLLRKNSHSMITRFFFLSFMSSGAAWVLFVYYNLLSCDCPHQIMLVYLGFYILIFAAMVLLAHACQVLIHPSDPFLPRALYLLLGASFVMTLLLILLELEHLPWFGDNLIGKTRHHSFLFATSFLISVLLPIGFSLYKLTLYPDWLTPERKTWIRRIQLGILLLIPYPLGEAIAGLHTSGFLTKPVSISNPLPLFLSILLVSNLTVTFATYVFLSCLPNVSKWFFDEVKYRATPALKKLNPRVSLEEIWMNVDQWQKEHPPPPKEMTNQKLLEYVQTVKKSLGSHRKRSQEFQ